MRCIAFGRLKQLVNSDQGNAISMESFPPEMHKDEDT